jgi:CubicO group peptidase (beta-lactamase class C family)
MTLKGLDQYIEEVRRDWRNVGVAVAVVQGDAPIYSRGVGLRQYGRAGQIDSDTLFQIGSLTKAFSAVAIGLLVDEGKVRWDDRVIDWIPTFRLRDASLTERVTVRDVLAHRTGISHNNYPFLGIISPEEAIEQLSSLEPEGQFRNSFVYSNLMYALVGLVVESVSGQSWHKFVAARILQPLQMRRSTTSPLRLWDPQHVAPTYLGVAPAGQASIEDAWDPNVAMPHWNNDDGSVTVLPWQNYDNAAPAGSVISSAADMTNWMIANLNGGEFQKSQFLTPETLRELHSSQNGHTGPVPFPFEGSSLSYAMGWWKTQYRGECCIVHSGGILGFPSYLAMLPERKIAVVVLANSAYLQDMLFHKSIVFWTFDNLLGAAPHSWSLDLLDRARHALELERAEETTLLASRVPETTPSLPLEKYEGEYRDIVSAAGRIKVSLENGYLILAFAGAGAYRASLEHWHHDVFRLHSSPASDHVLGPSFVSFSVTSTGEVPSLEVWNACFRRSSAH